MNQPTNAPTLGPVTHKPTDAPTNQVRLAFEEFFRDICRVTNENVCIESFRAAHGPPDQPALQETNKRSHQSGALPYSETFFFLRLLVLVDLLFFVSQLTLPLEGLWEALPSTMAADRS